MQFRFNVSIRTGPDRVRDDYTAHLERKNEDLEREIVRLRVAAAETKPTDSI